MDLTARLAFARPSAVPRANMNADGHRRVPSADKGLYVAYALTLIDVAGALRRWSGLRLATETAAAGYFNVVATVAPEHPR